MLRTDASASTWAACSSLAPDSSSIAVTFCSPNRARRSTMRSVPTTSVRPMPRKKPSGTLRLLTWMRNSPTGRRENASAMTQRHLGLEVRRQLTDVDDIDVGLGELAEPPLLRPLPAPDLLDLVAAEREGELARVLEHVTGERAR